MRPTLALFDSTEPEITSIAVAALARGGGLLVEHLPHLARQAAGPMLAARICSRLALLSPICRVPGTDPLGG